MSSLFGGSKPSIFGNTSSTGFGNTSNANQNLTTSGGFGAPQQPATTGLFGGTTGGNASGAPGLFGNNPLTSSVNPSPFSQISNQGTNTGTTAPTGGLFGAASGTTTNAPTTGMFGNTTNASTTGLFGNTTNAPATGLFGNTTTAPAPGAPTNNNAGTGLFGNTGANMNTNTGTGIGTGLFGSTNTAAPAPATGGLFSNPNTAAPATGGLFGSSTAPPVSNTLGSGGLFGNTGGMSGGTPTPGLSGNPTNNPTNTGFLGGNTSTSIFGQTQQQPAQQSQPPQPSLSVFGSSTLNQANQPLFGAQNNAIKGSNPGLFSPSTLGAQPTTSGLFGQKSTLSSSLLPTSSVSTLSNNPQLDIQQRIEALVSAWDPSSPQCRFQHYFYNLVDPNQVGLYGRPPNATNDALWSQAVRENPDPTRMVPVLALGFDDLQKRVDAQSTQAKLHTEKLQELQSRIAALAQTHVLSTMRNTSRVLQTYTLINHRLLRLVEHIHLLIPNLRSTAISPEEESLRANLERLREELTSGNGRGRLNELWALLGAVKAAKERDGDSEGMEWKVVDWDGLERLAAILAEQQQGLAHLTSVINNGLKDLQIMEGAQNTLPESVNSHFLQSSIFGNPRR